MSATTKSPRYGVPALAGLAMLWLLINPAAQAQTNFAMRFELALRDAQKEYATNTTNFNAALNLARAAFDRGEYATSDEARENFAHIGIGAANGAVFINPKSPAGHYYLALNIGQLARTKKLGALKLLDDMERSLKKSVELDQKYDHAGAMRTLAVLYMEAPGWPISVGSKSKARTLLERALQLDPNYPDNHLTYMEALQRWKDTETLSTRFPAFQAILPKAQQEFKGETWEDEWANWNDRWQKLQRPQ